jgi:hypothetical protein
MEEKTMKNEERDCDRLFFLDAAEALLTNGLGASIPGSGNENVPTEPK